MDLNNDQPLWLSTHEAIAQLMAVYGAHSACRDALVKRLAGGLIRSECRIQRQWISDNKSYETKENEPVKKSFWELLDRKVRFTTEDWKAGDFSYSFTGANTKTHFSVFAVRIKRDGVLQMVLDASHLDADVGSARNLSGSRPANSTEVDLISRQLSLPVGHRNLPPVSPERLRRWFAFFEAEYPPALNNEDLALQHARVTFPKNSVARQKVRDLRGAQKRGPKPSAE